MDNKKFTNSAADKLPLKKSKQYLWKYIQNKVAMKNQPEGEKNADAGTENGSSAFADFFKSLLKWPQRLASISVVAALLLVALVFSNILGDWFGGIIKIETVHASFEMVAVEEDGSGVATDSSFTLKASENLSKEVISDSLIVEPAVELEVKQTGDGEYKITPVDDLESNKIYQFSIKSESGEYSWAYQVQDTFKVTGTLPGDKSNRVPTDSGIEISFSHENYDFKNFSDYFEISPVVKGGFEQHRNIAVFVPENPLKDGTIYTVTVEKGLQLKDSDKKLEEDYVFQFETMEIELPSANADVGNPVRFAGKYNEIGSRGAVGLNVHAYKTEEKNLNVQVYKYRDANQYLEELKKTLAIPSWSRKDDQKYRTDQLENMGSFEAMVESNGYYATYLYLPNNTFEAGQYVFQIESQGVISQTLVQVTDVSNYINVSLTDTLVWVNDMVSGKSVQGAKVELGESGRIYETGADGVAKFKTPDEWKKDYRESSTTFVKITAKDGKVIFNVVSPYYSGEAGGFWQSFSTDRPGYKPTDKVQFFGFLKAKNKDGNTDNIKLQLVKDWDTFVKDVPLKIADDGTFIGETEIKNFLPGYYYLKMYQGKEVISQNGFEVGDYVKPAFNLTLTTDKKAVFAGENMNFHVKSNFFDGTPVANLEIDDYGKKGPYKTNENGEAKVTFMAKNEGAAECEKNPYYCSDTHNFYYEITSSLSEATEIYASESVRIFDSHLSIKADGKTLEENGKMMGQVKVQANWVDLSRLNAGGEHDYYDYLGAVAKDRIIDGDITEISWRQVETGQRYNFIEKKVEKIYRHDRIEKRLEGFRLQTDENGIIDYKFEIAPEKYYMINLYGPDNDGNRANGLTSVYGNLSRSTEQDYYRMTILNGEVEENNDWWWTGYEHKFGLGDTVEAAIANNEVPLDKATKGRFLFMQDSEGLQDYAVLDSPYYSFKFGKDDIPNVYVEGVWFNGREYIIPYSSVSAKYNREVRKLDIEVESDKTEYLPGDEVTLSVKVSDSDGSPARTKVNLNLVDEAYYKIAYDNFVDPLTEIYETNGPGTLFTYNSHVSPLTSIYDGGGKGGCFTGETQISMADGSTKVIKDIRKGDKILTKENEYSSRLVPAEVTGTVAKFVSEYLIINDGLEVTEEHIVFASGAWIRVADLKIGDSLLSQEGNDVKIFSMRRVVEPVWVYNIEIKGAHTYMAGGFYVHNQKGDDYLRQDFKDTAMFDVLETGADGRGKITFKLPDNITSWRVMAKAIDTANLRGGAKISTLKVSMPFFLDLIMNQEYSSKDSPMVKFRAYGNALKTNNAVVFKPELDGKAEESAVVNGKAFEGNYFTLPKLETGNHDVIIRAESGKLTDNLKKSFEVKGSRLKKDVLKAIRPIDDKTVFELSKEGPTEIKLMDSGAAYYHEQLSSLMFGYGDRLDQKIPQIAAAELMQKYFGGERDFYFDSEEANAGIIAAYQRGDGLSLLPYSSDDLRLTALIVALDSDPQRYSSGGLKDYFYPVYKNGESNLDELVYSLLGLASLKEPVLLSLREIQNEPKLTLEEKLYVALAFQNLGSSREALAVFNEVYDDLARGSDFQGVHETAIGAVVAAGLNLPAEAEKFWKFVELNGFDDEDVGDIYELGYVRNSLRHANFTPAEFKIKINEHEETVELQSGEVKKIIAFNGDRVEVSVGGGEVAALLHYEEAIEPEEFKKDPRLVISRKYFVNNREVTEFAEGDLVKVEITLDAREKFDRSFFEVTDILPSGLHHVTSYYGINNHYGESGLSYPFDVDGQELHFSWYPDDGKGSIANVGSSIIKYYARVTNPGEYYAEPAKVESFYDSGIANISEASVIKIGALRKQ